MLRRETKRASRSGRPLSLLFIDLDGFKAINDTHGHLFGSRALVEAAAVIRGSARETDVSSRFGGDEFALVLPDTGGEGAFAVGERIRERIAAHTFLAGDGLDIHLTASVGVATLPDVAASAEELMQAADKAMYRVKDSGKNGIQAAVAPADTLVVSHRSSSVTGRQSLRCTPLHSATHSADDRPRPATDDRQGVPFESSFDAFAVFE